MKTRLVVMLSLISISSAYTDHDDKINYDKIANNHNALRVFLNCLLDKGPCTDKQNLDKAHMFEAVNDGHDAFVIFNAFEKQFPELMGEVKAKYDSDGKHFDTIVAKLAKFKNLLEKTKQS